MPDKIPEDCPVRDILKNITTVLQLLGSVLEHCDTCIQEKPDEQRE